MERLTYRSSVSPTCFIDHVRGNAKEPHELNPQEVCVALNKLAKYEDLEEQGLLLRLPRKVGDTVFKLKQHNNIPYGIVEGKFKLNELTEIGKTVFLTRAEAEQKLKEMKEKFSFFYC